jgi:hypothetical protein
VPSLPPSLPAFATADGLVRGTAGDLRVDPSGPIAAPDAVVFTAPARALDVAEGTGTVFSPIGAEVTVGAGRRHRPVASVAVADLGGVVVEVVRLSPRSAGLVVVVRAVDERGRPKRSSPAVVFVGDLVTGSPPERPADPEIANTLDLLLGLLGADDVVVSGNGVLFGRTDVEDDRAARQQAIYQAPTLAEQAQRTLPLL